MRIFHSSNSLDITVDVERHYVRKTQFAESNDFPTLMSSDDIYILTPSGIMQKCRVKLNGQTLSYCKMEINGDNKKKDKVIVLLIDDIVGCSIEQVPQSPSPSGAYLNVIAYPIKNSVRKRKLITFVINYNDTFDENYSEAMKWKSTILSANNGNINTVNKKKYLIIINPVSGQSRAMKIFEQKVKPILIQSEIDYELLITQYSNHAMKVLQDIDDLSQYYAIIVVSGDGLLYEVINGLMKRADSETAQQIPVSLGIIPGGSGNGLAVSLNHTFLNGEKSVDIVFDSILHMIHGHPMPMDLVRVTTLHETIYSFLSLGWGLMSDIDIESERLRLIGEPRFTIWAVVRALALRRYNGTLSYLPVNCSNTSVTPLNNPIHSDWVKVEGPFVCIYAAYQSHIGAAGNIAPEARVDDEVIWLVYLRGDVTRAQVIKFLLALEKGKHVKLGYVKVIPVRALRIEPTNNAGILTVDGEVIECGPVQAEVVPRMATILTR